MILIVESVAGCFSYDDKLAVVAFNERRYAFALIYDMKGSGKGSLLDIDIFAKYYIYRILP